jgi:hypothetical protein
MAHAPRRFAAYQRRLRIGDLHGDEHRRGCDLLLPAEQNPRRNPIAPRHCGQVCTRLHGLLDNPALVIVAECSPMALARRWDDRSRQRIVGHMTKAMT